MIICVSARRELTNRLPCQMSSMGENSLNFDCVLIYLVTAGLETSLLGNLIVDSRYIVV